MFLFFVSCMVFILFNLYARTLSPEQSGVTQSAGIVSAAVEEQSDFNWAGWVRRFFVGFWIFFSEQNLNAIIKAFGVMTIPVAIISCILGWRKKELRSSIFFLLMAGVPLVLFWGIILGNSARHNLISCVFIYIIVAVPLATPGWRMWIYLLGIMCMVNYFYFPASHTYRYPSGRLFSTARLFKEYQKNIHHIGENIARLPYKKIVVLGKDGTHPYCQYEIQKYSSDAKDHQLFVWSEQLPSGLAELIKEGYYLVILDNALEKEVKKQYPQQEIYYPEEILKKI